MAAGQVGQIIDTSVAGFFVGTKTTGENRGQTGLTLFLLPDVVMARQN